MLTTLSVLQRRGWSRLDGGGRGGLCHVAPCSAVSSLRGLLGGKSTSLRKGIKGNSEEKNNYPQKLVNLEIFRNVSRSFLAACVDISVCF